MTGHTPAPTASPTWPSRQPTPTEHRRIAAATGKPPLGTTNDAPRNAETAPGARWFPHRPRNPERVPSRGPEVAGRELETIPTCTGSATRCCWSAPAARDHPACAGSTAAVPVPADRAGDHPRVRGERFRCSACGDTTVRPPPRARGAPRRGGRPPGRRETTPACAGSATGRVPRCTAGRDHPRVRGERGVEAPFTIFPRRPPPRARGALFLTWDSMERSGRSEALSQIPKFRARVSGDRSVGVLIPCCSPQARARKKWPTGSSGGGAGSGRRGRWSAICAPSLDTMSDAPRGRGDGPWRALIPMRGSRTPTSAPRTPSIAWARGGRNRAWDHPHVRGEQGAAAGSYAGP